MDIKTIYKPLRNTIKQNEDHKNKFHMHKAVRNMPGIGAMSALFPYISLKEPEGK